MSLDDPLKEYYCWFSDCEKIGMSLEPLACLCHKTVKHFCGSYNWNQSIFCLTLSYP